MKRILFSSTAMTATLALFLSGAAAAQSARDFQLPPNPSPTPSGPVVQGPVDEEAPVPATPRAIPAPTPTAATPARAPTATPTPTPRAADAPTVQPIPRATQTPRPVTAPTRRAVQPQPEPAPSPTASLEREIAPLPTSTAGPAAQSGEVSPGFSDELAPSAEDAGTAPAPTSAEPASDMPWPWLAALAAAIAALGGFFYWRRRGTSATPATIAAPAPATGAVAGAGPQPTPAPPAAPRAWLEINARALHLRRSMMNASLAYRLTVINRSGGALENVSIEADLATAHGKLPVEQQLASPASTLTPRHAIERLAPGERVELEGEIQIPLSTVKVIQQGKALLAVPLLRVRGSAGDRTAIARTWVIGQVNPQPGGKLRPFRLDAPPQTYTAVGQRPLD